jgi:hypothetical protein
MNDGQTKGVVGRKLPLGGHGPVRLVELRQDAPEDHGEREEVGSAYSASRRDGLQPPRRHYVRGEGCHFQLTYAVESPSPLGAKC